MRAIQLISLGLAVIGVFPIVVINIDNFRDGERLANAAFCVIFCVVYVTLIYALQYGITNKKYAAILQWVGFGLTVLIVTLEIIFVAILSQLH